MLRQVAVGLVLATCAALAQASVVFAAVAAPADRVADLKSAKGVLVESTQRQGDDVLVLVDVWHGLHFLMTGKDFDFESPAGQAIMGGKSMGAKGSDEPIRVMAPAQVKAVAVALASLDQRDLSKRFNPQLLERLAIHPVGIWQSDGDAALTHVLSHLRPLVDFYANAAKSGHAVVLQIE